MGIAEVADELGWEFNGSTAQVGIKSGLCRYRRDRRDRSEDARGPEGERPERVL